MTTARDDRAGWVYVLTNAAMPGLVKIGKTVRRPDVRSAELTSSSGVPLPFEVAGAAQAPDAAAAERAAHRRLEAVRVNGRREFFRCTPQEAIAAVRAAARETGATWRGPRRFRRRRFAPAWDAATGMSGAAWAWLYAPEAAAAAGAAASIALLSGRPRLLREFLAVPRVLAGPAGVAVVAASAAVPLSEWMWPGAVAALYRMAGV